MHCTNQLRCIGPKIHCIAPNTNATFQTHCPHISQSKMHFYAACPLRNHQYALHQSIPMHWNIVTYCRKIISQLIITNCTNINCNAFHPKTHCIAKKWTTQMQNCPMLSLHCSLLVQLFRCSIPHPEIHPVQSIHPLLSPHCYTQPTNSNETNYNAMHQSIAMHLPQSITASPKLHSKRVAIRV